MRNNGEEEKEVGIARAPPENKTHAQLWRAGRGFVAISWKSPGELLGFSIHASRVYLPYLECARYSALQYLESHLVEPSATRWS